MIAQIGDRPLNCTPVEKMGSELIFPDLRAATNGGWALGDAVFKQQLAKAPGRRVTPLPRGRPRRPGEERRQLSLL